jgi:chromosome segregation ATPase
MRSTSSANFMLALLLLVAGCATSPDPAKGGFFSGVSGLLSGGYDQRVAQQAKDLDRMRAQQAAAEAATRRGNATLTQQEQSIAKMRASVSDLDRSLKIVQTKIAQERADSSALSAKDRQLTRELESAKATLAGLRTQLAAGNTAGDYEAVRQEYQSLQAAIQALNEQLEGDQR